MSRRACSSVNIRSTPDSLPKSPARVQSATAGTGRAAPRRRLRCAAAVVGAMKSVWLAAMGSGQVRAHRGGVLVPRRRGDEREPDLDEGPPGQVPDGLAAAACGAVPFRGLVPGRLRPDVLGPLPGDLFHDVGVHLSGSFPYRAEGCPTGGVPSRAVFGVAVIGQVAVSRPAPPGGPRRTKTPGRS